MKKLSILTAFLFIPLIFLSQTIIPGGEVSGTWTVENSPYLIQGDIYVGDTLTINPGVEVIFTDSYTFLISSSLSCIGEENDSIKFTVSDTTGYYNGTNISFLLTNYGVWKEENKSKDNVIEMKYCKIEYGGVDILYEDFNFEHSSIEYGEGLFLLGAFGDFNFYLTDFVLSFNSKGVYVEAMSYPDLYCINGVISDNDGSGISCGDEVDLHVLNCRIKRNGAGISIIGDAEIDNVIVQNNFGGGIYWEATTDVITIKNSNISNNNGAGISLYPSAGQGHCEIDNTIIANNTAPLGGGIYLGAGDSFQPIKITNSIISNNIAFDGGGIYLNMPLNLTIENVLIENNHSNNHGGGIYSKYSDGTNLKNVTIVNNSSDSLGGGIYYEPLPLYPLIIGINSCIIWNNSPDQVFDTTGFINISYTNIKSGWSGTGNIDADPLFVDSENENYHLSWINYPNADYTKSPCIDTGDPNLPLDPDGTITDMGAYPFDQSAQQQVSLNIKAYLEGCYFSGQMTPFLNSLGFLPHDQPYFIEPWSHLGTETVGSIPNSGIIDWIFVEIRKQLNYSSLDQYRSESRQAAFIINDGSIVGIDGSSSLEFYTAEDDSLHLYLFHRNHIPVISSNPLTLENNPIIYDFTLSEHMAMGGRYSQNELSIGVWGMIAADGNADGQVDNNDKDEVWLTEKGNTGYYAGDFNMSSEVNEDDKIVNWELNSGKGFDLSDTTISAIFTCGDQLLDVREGQVYYTAQIGNQCWMAENLKTTSYRNSTPIPNVTNSINWDTLTTGAYVWYDNDITWKDKYGALYNWYAVNDTNGLCPTGWHVPTHNEWTILTDFIGGIIEPNGNKLKSCRQVNSPLGGDCSTSDHPRWDEYSLEYGTDDYGFSGLPGGYRNFNGYYYYLGNRVFWWTSTESSTSEAWNRGLLYFDSNVEVYDNDKRRGFSVRCIKD